RQLSDALRWGGRFLAELKTTKRSKDGEATTVAPRVLNLIALRAIDIRTAPGHFGKFPERKSSSMPTIRSTCVMNWSCTRTLFSIFLSSARLIGTSNSFRLVSPVFESGFCTTCGKPERGLPELSRTFTERVPVSLSFRRLIFTEN